MSALLELAARVEGLTGPDREVDAEIAVAVSGDSGAFVVAPMEDCIFQHIPGWWRDGADKSHDAPEYTASLDAAMTLVPKGRSWSVTDPANADGSRSVFACPSRCHAFVEGSDEQHTYGKTAALALCAAALRAKAVGEGV